MPIIRRKLLYLCDTGICHSIWVASGLLVGGKFQPADQKPPIQSDKHQCRIDSNFSWWWAHGCPKHVEKRNKYTKKNCVPSLIYLQDCSRMHGQQNIKNTQYIKCNFKNQNKFKAPRSVQRHRRRKPFWKIKRHLRDVLIVAEALNFVQIILQQRFSTFFTGMPLQKFNNFSWTPGFLM